MGGSSQSFHALDLKGMFLGNKGTCLWSKVSKAQAMRMRQEGTQSKMTNIGHGWRSRQRRILMKRRAFPKGSRRGNNGIVRRVRTLKKLVPNRRSKGLDGLFTETADYIVGLQMKVKIMEMMLNLLSKTDE